jgi:hypothetical protein
MAAERVMRQDKARRAEAPVGQGDSDKRVVHAIGEAPGEMRRPAAPRLGRRVDPRCEIEDADDWRWVRS